MNRFVLGSVMMLIFVCRLTAQSVVPLPWQMQLGQGKFVIDEQTALVASPVDTPALAELLAYFTEQIRKISSVDLEVASPQSSQKIIKVALKEVVPDQPESYQLVVSDQEITMIAPRPQGIFYAMQSLFQLLFSDGASERRIVPQVEIVDYPRFAWRGLMLDTVRHFYTPETIKQIIDLMSQWKMNVFHWHLCDDQGWRLEIKKYPQLTQKGAWRQEREGAIFYHKDSTYLKDIQKQPTFTYGGYYTQEQVADIVNYARLRGVRVVPEIEMPGHSGAVLSVFPQLSCNGKKQEVPTILDSSDFSTFNSNYCAGNPQTFAFLKDVLDEVIALFPSEYIHIGGDEVQKDDWKHCPKCQRLKRQQKLANEEEIQSYFIKTMEQYIRSRGRKLVGWDEILEGGIAPSATVMSWRGEKGGIQAAKQKHKVIMTPSNPLYFNRYQTEPIENEPRAAKYSINTLEKVYGYNPHPKSLTAEEQQYILGGQAALWTEFIETEDQLEYMLFPRLIALSEALWTTSERKNYSDFKKRIQPILKDFDQKGIRYFKKYN